MPKHNLPKFAGIVALMRAAKALNWTEQQLADHLALYTNRNMAALPLA